MEEVRKPTYDELLTENAQLKQRVSELEQQVIELKSQVDKLTQMLFGKKSEKSKKDKAKKQKPPSNEPKQRRTKNGGGGRKPFPPEIPRRDVPVPLAPEECRCGKCGQEYEPMGVEITEVLNVIPMILEVIRFIRQRMKATCRCHDSKIVIAEMPIRTIDKGSVTTEFVAAVLVNKYCDHLPVHRQTRRLLTSAKIDVAESSVCRWRDQVADQLNDLADLMKSEIKQSYCINTDASTAPCRLPKEDHRQVNGNMYVYIGGQDRPYHVFDFQSNQTASPIYEFLKGYTGVVQCDAHGNYNALFAPKIRDACRPPPTECGCHAHGRRGFAEAEKTEPEWSKRFLDIYKELYKIESEIKELSLEQRYDRRQSKSVPILDAFFDSCRKIQNENIALPKSPLGQACQYALNNEAALRLYCTDARLNIDNNVSERTLREFVIGRKNWLFFGSPEAGHRSAVVMSVLSSARRHGLNEWEYLVDVLYRLSDWNPSVDSLVSLLPDRWVKSPTPPTEAAALVAAR
jgi:transposase